MKVVAATLCLNEMEFLPRLYEQHKNWPGLVAWVFVEAADIYYARANPTLVSRAGLSTDGTTEWLADLVQRDPRVVHIQHGVCEGRTPDQGKVEARQRYLDVANVVRPDYVFVIDADEFYTHEHQARAVETLESYPNMSAALFPQRHIWRPASIAQSPLFCHEVVGGYWGVPHCRAFRWKPGMRYDSNHNWPEDSGGYLIRDMPRASTPGSPQCVHLGFASHAGLRKAKHRYYVCRGEGRADGRQSYVDCRQAFETWLPGDSLPDGARVVDYAGPVPEVFLQGDV